MSNDSLELFRKLVFESESLQAELLGIADQTEFTERVVALGATHGIVFSLEDVENAKREARRAWVERAI